MDKQKKSFKLVIPVPSLSFKSLIPFLPIFLIGAIIGGTAVYTYFNFKQQKKISQSGLGQYQQEEAAAYIKFKEIKKSFMPSGVPEIYGQELGISFNEVQDAIDKTAVFDPTYGVDGKKIALTDLSTAELERYKKIGAAIACEYCCGVKALTKEDGEAACGCAHSAMMRGLAAYLIKAHPQEFANEQILAELTKWKRVYFPKQTLSAELDRMIKAGESGIEQILKEFPDFLPQMVGGC